MTYPPQSALRSLDASRAAQRTAGLAGGRWAARRLRLAFWPGAAHPSRPAIMPGDDPYVMASFVKLLVADAARSASFYELLGFTRVHQDPVFVHLRWARHADLFLVATPPGVSLSGQRGLGVILCFSAVGDRGIETIAARAAAAGAAVDGPRDQPWHTREVVVTDPDNYRLCFVEPSTPLQS